MKHVASVCVHFYRGYNIIKRDFIGTITRTVLQSCKNTSYTTSISHTLSLIDIMHKSISNQKFTLYVYVYVLNNL